MTNEEMAQLGASIEQMTDIAKSFGLDFYPMRYEVCPADIIYTFGAYGMPTRFHHWSFGKQFHRMKLDYDLGMSRIYELVINSNPCYAFLLDGNTLLQNKTVCAHVLGHCDFFKNNATFRYTSRDMVERMAASAERIYHYELQYGRGRVEQLLDAGLALSEHIDASTDGRNARKVVKQQQFLQRRGDNQVVFKSNPHARTPYDDLWELDGKPPADDGKKPIVKPRAAQKDVMLFIIENSPALEEWERDILSILREEMLYFWPQLETKIMNEGWATYWHLRIMREMDLTDDEAIEFAKMHSGVVLPSRMSINPYHIGLAIWEDIERRWNEPTVDEIDKFGRQPGQGREKIFEVREMENDVSFLRNYLTKDLIEKLDLYLYQKVGNDWRVVETDWEKVRDTIVASRVNGGIPVLYVEDGDYNRNGELYIKHEYEGVELDLRHLERTLPYLHRVWGRQVHLQTVVEGRDVIFSYDGKKTQRRFVKE
ncbi:stage V sporulation protein R [Alicyclobacillus hesperidum subsp. aegles]|uniref:SpoVR family protein n=1 Tax=Alicyclobacillus hesperidum TaxID=89784 RepID=UPI0007191B9C|nr:SpoVR family protein [Alicyclobacillus hesperidum]KRW91297.1 stage V sporulation protein R [Alicyclobacillus tengchongensis]GLG01306.1 stage V sporulation protein R [Alicyclobacillus hesperidum subsp. aegles]